MSERPKIRIQAKGNSKLPAPEEKVPDRLTPKDEIKENTTLPEVKETSNQQQEKVDSPTTESINKKRNYWKWIALAESGILVLLFASFFLLGSDNGQEPESNEDIEVADIDNDGIQTAGIEIPEGASKREDIIGENTDLKAYLLSIGLPSKDVDILNKEGMRFGLNKLRIGDKVTMFYEENQMDGIIKVYIDPKIDPYTYFVCHLDDNFGIEKLQKEVEIKQNHIAAIIENNLGSVFIDKGFNLKLIGEIEEIFKWSIDFFDVKAGDRFKILYEEEYLNGKPHMIKKIIAVFFEKDKKEYYAFKYDQNGEKGFFDEHGRSMKKSFLSSPIKYGGVMTSGYGLRIHPVTGHAKNHLGTDYAAEEGTEIQAVADGVISIATFKANNGNYVKMRHDKIYETQYLHMKGFAPGISPGVRVKQGDIIGYVGTTGLSTGPHVCFRFWKNEQQVNPMEENASTSKSVSGRILNDYISFIEPVKAIIDSFEYM
jgi:murein DD-endopeptidase MepM/ murein hydrolase activator NlpD